MDCLFDMFMDFASDCFLCRPIFFCYSGNVNRSTGHFFVSIECFIDLPKKFKILVYLIIKFAFGCNGKILSGNVTLPCN